MLNGANVAYLYDGSFYGLLNCAYEALKNNELPVQIKLFNDTTLFETRNIESDENKAAALIKGIQKRISPQALELVKCAYLCEFENKELAVINFLHSGFNSGAKICEMINEESVAVIKKAVKLLGREEAKFIQFIRFSDFNGVLVSIIEPVNHVLPLIARHFMDRFPNEQFMIYDKTHSSALIYDKKSAAIIPAEDYEIPSAGAEELKYRRLWKMFYQTIAIKERKNERCRMNFMPKKYWKNMTEFMAD